MHHCLAHDCMLKKQEEKKEKVKYDDYIAMKTMELHGKSKNLSLVSQSSNDNDGTNQICSSCFDDEEMHHPIHGVMYPKHVVDDFGDKTMFGEFLEGSD